MGFLVVQALAPEKHEADQCHVGGQLNPALGQWRLVQLEERLVCNQKAGGSNLPASM